MVDSRPAPPFGQVIGEAQQALRGLLDDVLDAARVSHPAWLVLNFLAVQGPSMPLDKLSSALAGALRVDRSEVSELLRGVEAAGHIELLGSAANEQVELTAEGVALYRNLRVEVDKISANALAGIPPQDVETTVSVLRRVRAQAQDLRGRVASA